MRLADRPSRVHISSPTPTQHAQYILDAKNSPQAAMGGDVAGVGHATSGSATDNLTRQHRMTLDEAQLILNVKREEQLEGILKVCWIYPTRIPHK